VSSGCQNFCLAPREDERIEFSWLEPAFAFQLSAVIAEKWNGKVFSSFLLSEMR
jgi:hypothetical protein